jgi:hypothetical protein
VDLGVGNAHELVYCTSQPESLSQYACKHAVAHTQASRGGRWWDGVGDMEEVVEYRGGILSQSPRSCSCIPIRHLGLTQALADRASVWRHKEEVAALYLSALVSPTETSKHQKTEDDAGVRRRN